MTKDRSKNSSKDTESSTTHEEYKDVLCPLCEKIETVIEVEVYKTNGDYLGLHHFCVRCLRKFKVQ